MPRNIRRKAAPPSQTKRRRGSDSSSSLDLSSDGGYSALDEVSDSEDDDEDGVYAAEEKHIIKDVTKVRHAHSPRPSVQNEEEDADEEEEEDDDDLDEIDEADILVQDEDDDEESEDNDDAQGVKFADDGASWNGISESDANHNGAASGSQASPVKRQVRFAGVPDSDSDSTTTETSDIVGEFFPDIFVEQNALDPGFRREIELESDSSVSSSFWDYASGYGYGNGASVLPFPDDDMIAAALADPVSDLLTPVPATAEEEDEQDLDGYETDGDTTEEDEPEPLPLRRKQTRRVQSIDSDDDSSDSESENDLPVRHRRGHPRVRRFALTLKGKKPVAVMHPVTGAMVIFTPEKPQEFDIMSDPFPAPDLDLMPPHNELAQSSPLMGNTASVMMGAMLSSNTFGDFMHSQHVGPVEAFFPTLSSDAFLAEDSDFSGDFIQDDGESNLRIEDFIQFDRNMAEGTDPIDEFFDVSTILGQAETDDIFLGLSNGLEDEDDATTPVGTPIVPPNTRRTSFAATSSVGADDDDEVEDGEDAVLPPLLAHFGKNSDAVGAFRRNQINQQLIYSNKATAESLDFSGPYTMGTLRGIKNGSLEAVATPITPPRRLKRPSMSAYGTDYARSPLDPAVQKRKASGAVPDGPMDHKRQRSISEVKDIML